MLEFVEIGMGRTARKTWDLHDIDIVASRRTRSSKDVSLSWKIDAYNFDIPFMTNPNDAIVSPESAAKFAKLGGMSVLNAEGVWARYPDAQNQLDILTKKFEDPNLTRNKKVALVQDFYKKPIDNGVLNESIEKLKKGGHTVAVRVSPQLASSLTPVLVKAGVEILVISGTIISAEHVSTQPSVNPINLKNFIADLDIPVIAGGVSDHRTALHLMRSGAAGVIVGYGAHNSSTTTVETLGIYVPMATAIADAAAARRDYLDETGGRYVHVIADGRINNSGDAAKAIACGADAVVLGHPLAAAKESPAKGYYWPIVASHPSAPRGEVYQNESYGEGYSLEEILRGPSSDPLGRFNFAGGLARSMAKAGYSDVKEFQKVSLNVHA